MPRSTLLRTAVLAIACAQAPAAPVDHPERVEREIGAHGSGLTQREVRRTPLGPFGWDMTYAGAFDAAGVARDDTIRKLFRDSWSCAEYTPECPTRPDEAVFDGLNAPNVRAALVIDHIAFYYFGHRVISVAYSSDEHTSIERTWDSRRKEVETSTGQLDVARVVSELMHYVPSRPRALRRPLSRNGASPNYFANSGYIGAVSLWLDGKRRQFLLTPEDLMTEGRGNTKLRPGRLARTIELARMPPDKRARAQALDAQIEALEPLFRAVDRGDLDALAALLARGTLVDSEIDGETLLLAAIRGKQPAAVRLLLERGARANGVANDGKPLAEAAALGQLEIVRALVAAGASVDPPQPGAETGLLGAVRSSHLDVARYLIEQGADVNRGTAAATPLTEALTFHSDPAALDLLLRSGADVNAVLRDRTPLMTLAIGTNAAEGDKSLWYMRRLIEAGADVNALAGDCWTALRWAQHMHNERAAALLLEYGADPARPEQCRAARKQRATQTANELRKQGIEPVDHENFDRIVLQSARPVIVYFRSNDCSWCLQMDSVLLNLASRYGNEVAFAKVDVQNEKLLATYSVTEVPTLTFFRNGKVKGTLVGAKSESETLQWIQSHLR